MTPAEARLREVPWSARAGLDPLLAPALEAVLGGRAAADVLDRLLRDHRHFSADQRRVCAEALFGVGLWRRRLRAHCGPTASPLALLDALATGLPPCTDWRDRTSIPDWFAELLLRAFGPDAERAADAFNLPGPVTIRTNRARITCDALAARLADEGRPTTPGRLGPDALHLVNRPANLTATAAWREGLFELQDEGSQLLAELVPARDGDSVLDLCAGAGGKTLALGSRLPGTTIDAFDIDAQRLDRLRTRATRAQASVRIHSTLPTSRFRHILIDAPCSELGALRRGPDVRWRIDPATFDTWPPIQLDLLRQAAARLEPQGTITFATCTLRPEENEHLIARFLDEQPAFTIDAPALRLTPHEHGTDGFFGIVLRAA